MVAISLLLIIVLSVGCLYALFYLIEGIRYTKPDRVVYMGSDLREQGKILEDIIRRYVGDEAKKYSLIEPGAGLATVATYLGRRFQWKQIVAIELRRSVLWLGILRQKLHSSRVIFKGINLFDYEPPTPNVHYCYLTTPVLERLHRENRLKNSLVICLTFEIPGCTPVEVIPLKSWQQKISVYDFRAL